MAQTMNRRAALGRIAVAVALAVPAAAVAAIPADADAEIIALSAEILTLAAASREITATRIDPFEDNFQAIFRAERDPKKGWKNAWAYSAEVGRDAAIEEVAKLDRRADDAFLRMIAIPAKSAAGRAAKVRALLVHVMRDEWRGPANELDWDRDQARALLGEFAGIGVQELAEI